MRLPIIPPANLNAEQKPLYDDMREGIARNFQGFINVRDDGALLALPHLEAAHRVGAVRRHDCDGELARDGSRR